MNSAYHDRRYLIQFDSRNFPQTATDCLIIGSGIAGLRAAIEVSPAARTTVVTKRSVTESNTANAQGGVAVVLQTNGSDDLKLHMADTIKVGCGLNDQNAVETVVRQGPQRIRELIDWGARFDSTNDELELGREAGHSASRVIHAHGDATGREVANALINHLNHCPNIQVLENRFVIDLITHDRRCLGALIYTDPQGLSIIWAKRTILATGGCGRVWQETTNPEVASGDGMAAAWRAGAVLQNMAMMQFHPTTLYVAGASRALISEAVRGEGAYLVDKNSHRFMPDYHPDAELAPRDVVSQAIIQHMKKTGSRSVFLDVRHLGYDAFAKRFPNITELCESFGINLATELIPVRPSAHYMIGGVKADMNARTSIDRLYACGEVACSGLHGANRLASNSLLEGLVFGAVAGRQAANDIADHPQPPERRRIVANAPNRTATIELDLQDMRNSLRSLMWRHVGIERTADGLAEAAESIAFWGKYVLNKTFDTPFGWEAQNLLTVAYLVTRAAGERTESRGVHLRLDFPERDDKHWLRHILLCRI